MPAALAGLILLPAALAGLILLPAALAGLHPILLGASLLALPLRPRLALLRPALPLRPRLALLRPALLLALRAACPALLLPLPPRLIPAGAAAPFLP